MPDSGGTRRELEGCHPGLDPGSMLARQALTADFLRCILASRQPPPGTELPRDNIGACERRAPVLPKWPTEPLHCPRLAASRLKNAIRFRTHGSPWSWILLPQLTSLLATQASSERGPCRQSWWQADASSYSKHAWPPPVRSRGHRRPALIECCEVNFVCDGKRSGRSARRGLHAVKTLRLKQWVNSCSDTTQDSGQVFIEPRCETRPMGRSWSSPIAFETSCAVQRLPSRSRRRRVIEVCYVCDGIEREPNLAWLEPEEGIQFCFCHMSRKRAEFHVA